MESSDILNDHERRISQLEGKLDSLATKELVLQSNAELLREINEKMQAQTRELTAKIDDTNKRIDESEKRYTKLAGAAVAIALLLSLLVGAANLIFAAASAGLIQLS